MYRFANKRMIGFKKTCQFLQDISVLPVVCIDFFHGYLEIMFKSLLVFLNILLKSLVSILRLYMVNKFEHSHFSI